MICKYLIGLFGIGISLLDISNIYHRKCNEQPFGYNSSCSFEIDSCLWVQDISDDFDWTIHEGQTPSTYTGPSVDHTLGTEQGRYLYIEASEPRTQGEIARLISPVFSTQTPKCLSLWYNMYGSDIGDLIILLSKNSSGVTSDSVLLKLSGDQGQLWTLAQIGVPASTTPYNYTLIIEGTVGTTYRGDIAIDDILVRDVECKIGYSSSCSFEKDTCLWVQDISDDFDWTIHEGQTPSTYTGPSVDHTLGTEQGRYLYIEASEPRTQGEIARLKSPVFSTQTPKCLSFWYNMYGSDIGDLIILLSKNSSGVTSDTVLLKLSGDQGQLWKLAQIGVPASSTPYNYTLIIEGTVGTTYRGDIAIDDILVRNVECKSLPNITDTIIG